MTNQELPSESNEQKDGGLPPEGGEQFIVPEKIGEEQGEITITKKIAEPNQESKFEATIPLMITRKMKEDLYSKGYSDEQIDKLTLQQAHEILNISAEVQAEKVVEQKVEAKEPVETGESQEKFENPEYDIVKKSYDPLYKLMEELNVKNVSFTYLTVESVKPTENPEFDGQVPPSLKSFNNYHDLIKFRNSLTEEQKKEFDSKEWGVDKEHLWSGISVRATKNFWGRLNNPEDELYKDRTRIIQVVEGIEKESLPDYYQKAIEENNVHISKEKMELIDKVKELRQLIIELTELKNKVKNDELQKSYKRIVDSYYKRDLKWVAESLDASKIESTKNKLIELKEIILDVISKQELQDIEPAKKTEKISELAIEFKVGEAIWHSPTGDVPVEILVDRGIGKDGKHYVGVKGGRYFEAKGYENGIPLNEIVYADKPGISERFKNIWEKTKNIAKDPETRRQIATAVSRGAAHALGYKIIQESLSLGISAIKAKSRGEENAWQKTLEKSSTDLGRYLYGKRDTEGRRAQLQQTIEEAFKEHSAIDFKEHGKKKEDIKEGAGELMQKFKDIDELIKGATYLNDIERQTYRRRLAKTLWENRNQYKENHKQLQEQVAKETEDYIHNKSLKYAVARDALNFGLTASGAVFIRLAGMVGLSAAGRGTQAYREFMNSEPETKMTEEEIGEGKATRKKFRMGAGFIAKDMTWNVAKETVNALLFRGRNERLLVKYEYDKTGDYAYDDEGFAKGKKYYGRKFDKKRNKADFVAALGTVGTVVGMASLVGGDNVEKGIADFTEKFKNNWSERGVGMFPDNFLKNGLQLGYNLTHPGEALERMRQAVLGGEQEQIIVSKDAGEKSAVYEEFWKKKEAATEFKIPFRPNVADTLETPLPPDTLSHYQAEISQGKLTEEAIKLYGLSHPINVANPPSAEEIAEFSELTTVDKGGSYWSTLMKQYQTDPKNFGYEGDMTDKKEILNYGKQLVANYAFRESLVIKNADGSLTDVRIKDPNARIVWRYDKDKGLTKLEYSGKAGAEFETYKHISSAEVKTGIGTETKSVDEIKVVPMDEIPSPRPIVSKILEAPTTIETGVEGSKNIETAQYYHEVNLLENFRDAKSFDHNLRVYTGDLPEVGVQPDGLIDHLQFKDDDDDLLVELELAPVSHKSLEQSLPEIYQRTQALDRNLSDLQALVPKSGKTMNLVEQVSLGKLVVPNNSWLEDGALKDSDYSEKLVKLDNIFSSHKEYLADKDFAVHVAKNIDDIESDLASKLYSQGHNITEKLGFKNVDYEALQRYIEDNKPMEFVRGDKGLEYQYLDDAGRPYHSVLTGKKIVLPVAEGQNFDEPTINRYRLATDSRLNSEIIELNNLKDKVEDADITRQILALKCKEVTDTEISELFSADERGKSAIVFNYLVEHVGQGNEQKLDSFGDKTLGEVLSEIAQKRVEPVE